MRGRENERENAGSWKINGITFTKSTEPMFYLICVMRKVKIISFVEQILFPALFSLKEKRKLYCFVLLIAGFFYFFKHFTFISSLGF